MKKFHLLSFVLILTFILTLPISAVFAATPAAPKNLKASVFGSSSISLNWSAVTGASKYEIYMGTSTSAMTRRTTITSTKYTISALNSSTKYYFKVRARNASGIAGAFSSLAGATTKAGISAPGGLNASVPSASSIKLTWNSVSGASKYTVYRSASSSGTYKKIATVSVKYYTDTGLKDGTLYYYKVRAVNSIGEGLFSSAKAVRTRPSKPTGLKAASLSLSSVKLTWNAVSGASKYYIYRSTSSGGTYSRIAYTSSTSYTNTALSANKLYYYKVAAFNSGGIGSKSSIAYARTRTEKPTGLKAASLSSSSIKLTWNAVSGANKYYIYRATSSGGTYSRIAYTTSTSYTNTALSANTLYYYKVAAVNSGGTSSASTAVSSRTKASAPTLAAPLEFRAETYNYQSVQLYYNSVQNAATYRIYYSTTAASDISTYEHFDFAGINCRVVGLNANTAYYFRVAAVDSGGNAGTPTGYLAAKTSASPGSPPQPNFYLYSMEDVGSYRLNFYRGTNPVYPALYEPTFKFYVSVTESSLNTDSPDICDPTQYFYEDIPYGQSRWFGFRACYGPYKSTMQKLHFAALDKPVNVKTTPISNTVTLSWNSVYSASKYKLYYCIAAPDITVPWQQFRDSALASGHLHYVTTTSGTSYTFTGMPNYSKYYYIVVPADASGVEGWYCGYAIGSIFY